MRPLVLTLVLVLAASAAFAQSDSRNHSGGPPMNPNAPRDGAVPNPGIPLGHVAVGEQAPDFDLPAAGGRSFHLKSLRGHWVALFFADRREELDHLSALAHTLDSLQFASIAVFNERVQTLTNWKRAGSTSLVPVSDDRGEISALYGVWDSAHAATRPGLFLIDPQGYVKMEVLGQRIGASSLTSLVQSAVDGL